MDFTALGLDFITPDLHLVLTDWFEEDETGPQGYGTFHISLGPGSGTGVCGREGLPYTFFSKLLSTQDEMMCITCVEEVYALLNDGYENGEF